MLRTILSRLDSVIEQIEKFVLFFGMAAALVASLVNVVMRYVFSYPLAWPPELARYCIICVVFIGASAAIKSGTHLKVDVINQLFPKMGRFNRWFSQVIVIVFAAAVIYISKDLIHMQYVTRQKSIVLEIPFCLLYAIPAMASILMIVRSLIQLAGQPKEQAG
ncbi:putative TRAP-type C4-dicarboxylate transporter permease, small subunit DctQ [uncultured Desulfatiglans sp.]|nr:putative TRAP-type C4-dicarboxylate transporter permease, small subunit DctQ [uncultured Desulfatiglans sp.]